MSENGENRCQNSNCFREQEYLTFSNRISRMEAVQFVGAIKVAIVRPKRRTSFLLGATKFDAYGGRSGKFDTAEVSGHIIYHLSRLRRGP